MSQDKSIAGEECLVRALQQRAHELGLPDVDDRLAESLIADVDRLQRAVVVAAASEDWLGAPPGDFLAELARLRGPR